MSHLRCPKGHPCVIWIAGDYPSGVEMNGYREYLSDEGYLCECCDKVYDVTDIEDVQPLFDWSITPQGVEFQL